MKKINSNSKVYTFRVEVGRSAVKFPAVVETKQDAWEIQRRLQTLFAGEVKRHREHINEFAGREIRMVTVGSSALGTVFLPVPADAADAAANALRHAADTGVRALSEKFHPFVSII